MSNTDECIDGRNKLDDLYGCEGYQASMRTERCFPLFNLEKRSSRYWSWINSGTACRQRVTEKEIWYREGNERFCELFKLLGDDSYIGRCENRWVELQQNSGSFWFRCVAIELTVVWDSCDSCFAFHQMNLSDICSKLNPDASAQTAYDSLHFDMICLCGIPNPS